MTFTVFSAGLMTIGPPRVLATRRSKTLADTLELLCLEPGLTKRYRLYTTIDESLSETMWDLDPVEFDSTDDPDLHTYLTESFWMTTVSPLELRRACELYSSGVTGSPVGATNEQSVVDLGSLGVVLMEMFNRIQTIDPSEAHSSIVLQELDTNLRRLEALPNLSDSVRNSIHGCRLVYRELQAEAVLQAKHLGH